MSKTVESNELLDEYNFSDGVQGKHYKSYKEGVNTIFLEPDIAKVFKNSESVNHALRMLIGLAGNELKRNIS